MAQRNIITGPPIPGKMHQRARIADQVYGDNTQVAVYWLHGDGSARDVGTDFVLMYAYNRNTGTRYDQTLTPVDGVILFTWGSLAPVGEYFVQFGISPDRAAITGLSYPVPVTVHDQITV